MLQLHPPWKKFHPRNFVKRPRRIDYTSGSQYQAVFPVETPFSDFDHKTLLHLATKSSDPRVLNDNIS